MLRDDDRIDDDFQGNAYAPFLRSSSRGSRPPVAPAGYWFYGLVVLALVAVLGVNALAQTAFAGLVFGIAAFICLATLVSVVTLGERRGGALFLPLIVTIGSSIYVMLVAGIASLLRR